jgi:RNA polymerase sigma factor (sigma-70 family)
VAQTVFTDLARPAGQLKTDAILTAWLYAVTRRPAIDVIRKESRRQLREQIAVEMNHMNATANEWAQIEPLLDDAMAALDEADRNAVLLRYFENKSLRDVGAALGASEDAAQKRVSRAVDRLRESFSKRNVTIGAGGLAVLISANAVQSAPVGLAVTVSTAALAGTAISTSTALTTTKVIAMTTWHKTIIGATLAAAVGTGIYEVRRASRLRVENQNLLDRQAQLTAERDAAVSNLMRNVNAGSQTQPDRDELLRLRSEVGRLRRQTNEVATLGAENQRLRAALTQNRATSVNPLISDPEAPDAVPKESWALAGYATPEATVQTLLWALHKGDSNAFQVYMDGLAPSTRMAVEQEVRSWVANAFAGLGTHETGGMTDFRILKNRVVR